jgi:hypothetical protein
LETWSHVSLFAGDLMAVFLFAHPSSGNRCGFAMVSLPAREPGRSSLA